MAASKRARGRVIQSSDPRFMASGWNVPQWMGTTRPARLSRAASAACSASMCPADSRGPQPWIGNNANEIGPPASSDRWAHLGVEGRVAGEPHHVGSVPE
jgi:hypothetical protein